MGFMDSYKQLEKICGELLNDDRRLSAYIDEMKNISNGSFYLQGWDEDLKRLKHYRWIRNQIVHEPNCTEQNMCEVSDVLWLDNFYLRIMNQSDPIALYYQATKSCTVPKVKYANKIEIKNHTYSQQTDQDRNPLETTLAESLPTESLPKRGGFVKRKAWIVGVLCVCIACTILICVLMRYQHTSAARLPDQYEGQIEQLHSSIDRDQDGIDDQTDILNGAFCYVASQPKYKSKYYQTGYPDDEYGVCTDVVANALKSAGYDLRELVGEDVAQHLFSYSIQEPDSNIDFRRVRNLKVFFARTALSLTTDISDIEEWQGGDIVIFEKHIGIVSDRRNKNGVPYVIHHNDPWQKTYEQDILEERDDIVGHYRMSE